METYTAIGYLFFGALSLVHSLIGFAAMHKRQHDRAAAHFGIACLFLIFLIMLGQWR